jgi:hypothetical protein
MITALLSLFVFGSLWFWGLLAVASIILISCLEKGEEGGATFVFLATLAAVVFLGNTGWLTYIIANPLSIGLFAGAYLLIGVGWGIIKWWIYLHDVSARNRAERYDWVAKRKAGLNETDDNYEEYKAACTLAPKQWSHTVKEAWKDYVDRHYYGKPIKKPMVSENKARITAWMTYWPWSALWTLLNDPIRRFYRWTVNQLRGLLQGMSDKAFRDLD